MASKRLSKLKSSELDPSERGLAEEEEQEFNLSGVLSLTTEEELKNWDKAHAEFGNSDDSEPEESEEDSDEGYDKVNSVKPPANSISRGLSISEIKRRTSNIKFDIMNTRISSGKRKKYVLYLLVVTRTPGLDSDKAIIERRYSDFYKLHKQLKKMFPEFINNIEFPEKKFYGNLDNSLISVRCRLLQQFIQKVFENQDVRNCDTFKKFFYVSSLQQGCQYICGGQFEVALNLLLNGLHLQQKLALDSSDEVIATLCNIIVCYVSLENYKEVEKYSLAALELIEDNPSSVYQIPLLQTLKKACSILGKNTDDTERKLKEVITLNQIEVEHLPSLTELAVKRFTQK